MSHQIRCEKRKSTQERARRDGGKKNELASQLVQLAALLNVAVVQRKVAAHFVKQQRKVLLVQAVEINGLDVHTHARLARVLPGGGQISTEKWTEKALSLGLVLKRSQPRGLLVPQEHSDSHGARPKTRTLNFASQHQENDLNYVLTY
jgi:hypothetical protein